MAPLGINTFLLGAKTSPFKIQQSLRFDRSSYLSRTFTTGNGRIWSLSVWLKRAGGIGDNDRDILGAYTGSYPRIGLVECGAGPSSDHFGIDQGGPSGNGTYYANGLRRDPSAWYHLVISVDYNSPSAKIWVNGVLEGAASNSLAADGGLLNTAIPHEIGGRVTGASTSNRWDGYMAEFHFLDTDSQLSDPYDFGEFDDNGIWLPKEYTGSHGDAGFYLKFDPTATNGIGHDHSGNGNNWTANGFTTSGTGTDVMSDTPTKNWCTLNATDKGSNVTLSNGNLAATTSSTWGTVRGTVGASTGKWYYEFTLDGAGYTMIGVQSLDDALPSTYLGTSSDGSYGYFSLNGTIYANGATLSPSYSTFTTGDIIGVAWDGDAGKIWFAKNGTWQGSGDPSAGTNALVTGIPNDVYTAGVSVQSTGGTPGGTANFGQRDFAYTPPTGFKALNTSNLPAPTIKDGSDYFNTAIWSGDGTSPRTISNGSFQPDLVWTKTRSDAVGHFLFDSVRGFGVSKELMSHSTREEGNSTTNTAGGGYVSGVTSTGFEVTAGSLNDNFVNDSGRTYVAWNWKAGGSGSSNTDGSITSTVSVNATAGFSIVSWTGDGSASATVGHGLGVVPSMIWAKSRGTSEAWMVKHKDLASNNVLELANANATADATTFSNGSLGNLTSSTTFGFVSGSIGVDSVNKNSDPVIAYCFASVEGYSKVSSYSGGDGVFVYLGFKPSLLILKGTVGSRNWIILDSERSTYNVVDDVMHPNRTDAESVQGSSSVDFVSNGFVTRGGNISGSGDLTVFAAFAENPFGGDGVSPATAR